VRHLYRPFESGLDSPTGRVYFHEIPGGQLSNLRQQAIALGLGDRFEAIEDMYAAANRILGNLVKVTPSSKVVGDLALALVGAGADPKDFEDDPQKYDIPDSVIGFLNGELGDPPGGWPEPFRTKALAGRRARPRLTELTPEQEKDLQEAPRRTLNQLLFPGPTKEFESSRESYGDLSVLGTVEFLHGLEQGEEYEVEIEPGKVLIIGVQSIGEADPKGMRTVMCTLGGQFRPISVRDRSVEAAVKSAEKADPSAAGHVAAPFAGVVTLAVAEGDSVEAGGVVATIEAMKMEANITSPGGGTVSRVAIGTQQQVEGGDLLVVIG
jgi:pyruvate carboxylase